MVTVTRNSALGTSPTTSALGKRCFVLPASLDCFCPAFMIWCSFLFLDALNLVAWSVQVPSLAGRFQSADRWRIPRQSQVDEVVEHVKPERRAQDDGERREQYPQNFQGQFSQGIWPD